MKLKDLLGISLVSLFLFPIILIGIMLAAGVAHIEFGNGKEKERIKPVFTANDQVKQEEAEAKQLKAFKALEQKGKELEEQQAEVNRETERLENLKMETLSAKEAIAEHHRKIEELVGKSSEVQDKQIASLAEVYGGMRPDEAAPILLSLDDAMVVRILRKIPETRATSKLLAALGALDVKRTAKLTSLLGGKGKTHEPVAPAGPETKALPASNKESALAPASSAVDSLKQKASPNPQSPKPLEAQKNGPAGKA
jgi:flagellar motility protein MotE (MotC chaperone)